MSVQWSTPFSEGATQSWQMKNRYKTMDEGKYEFGFAVEWMRKDLSICFTDVRRNGTNLPIAAVIDQFLFRSRKDRLGYLSLLARLV